MVRATPADSRKRCRLKEGRAGGLVEGTTAIIARAGPVRPKAPWQAGDDYRNQVKARAPPTRISDRTNTKHLCLVVVRP
jgi:hypothetical protein